MDTLISQASPEDLPAILAVQKAAFWGQAKIYNDFSLPPLVQTFEELVEECRPKIVLKAEFDGKIIGTVRADEHAGTCRIGRLAVLPENQGQGVGVALMRAIEARFSSAKRFAIFTGHKSLKNIRLYERLGYTQTEQKRVSEGLIIVYMEKENANSASP